MKPNLIERFLFKVFAKQLRRPSGLLAKKVGNKMNNLNDFLYDFAIDTMNIEDGDSILEIGFGNGKLFDRIFSKANNLKISGLDFSSNMVKEAIAHNQSTIASGKLILKYGCSDNIPFEDDSFDKVFCVNVIYFWEQPAKDLKEIYRVLKPRGMFYTAIRTKESMLRLPFTNYGFTLYGEEEWKNVLEANGFQFVKAEKVSETEELDGQQFELKSLCIVAEKAV